TGGRRHRLRNGEPALCGDGSGWNLVRQNGSRHRIAPVISARPLPVSWHTRESRNTLYIGMLSRGHMAGLGAVSSACINFQIWEAISEKPYSIDSGLSRRLKILLECFGGEVAQ